MESNSTTPTSSRPRPTRACGACPSMKLPLMPLQSRDGSAVGQPLPAAPVFSPMAISTAYVCWSEWHCSWAKQTAQVIGSVNTMLRLIYTTQYTDSNAQNNVSSIAFAGTVVGQLFFGYLSDHWSRKNALLISTLLIIVFAALGAGSYGAGGSAQGLFAALTAWRFLLGIGIGGEYPAGSVACAESTGEMKAGHRNRWFIFFTNFTIDVGFVVAALVPMILVLIFGEDHLRAVW